MAQLKRIEQEVLGKGSERSNSDGEEDDSEEEVSDDIVRRSF